MNVHSMESDATAAPDNGMILGLDLAALGHDPLRASLFQTVADNYSGSIIITSPAMRILYVNPALLKMTGYAAADVLGKTPRLFKSGQTSADAYRSLWKTVAAGGIWTGEFINRRKDGTQYLESKTISAIRDAQNQIQFYFAIGEDMQQRQRHQQHIDSLLATDRRTGLPNRSAFLSTLVMALDQAHQETREATVLHIDLDDSLELNDRLGTDQADRLMLEMAERIKGTLRQADHLASLGGDTFAILLGPHEQDAEAAIHELSERVLAAIRQPLQQAGTPIHVTASIGIASFPNDSDLAGELLSRAINASEQAKTRGGNTCFRFDGSAARSTSAQRELLNELRLAIEGQQLVLHYQPQISLFSGRITGLEALIRWQHPQRGLVPPGEFIPLAEQSHCIIEIGEWVLRESCRQMRAWLDAGLPPIKVAINLAADHLLRPELPATLAETLSRYRLEARFLEIEITESAMMQDVTKAIRSTLQLKDVGVRISLDDFGTGYSSLAYLSRFPIDVVKIDQSFVRDITSNPVNAAIAQAIIAMSHKLNKTVLAEGVETEEQMQYLRRNESDEMQGFFFSRPVPAENIARLLAAGSVMRLTRVPRPEEHVCVLFVDDESNILASLKRTLRREGYEILTASSASEGFALLAKNPIQVVVSDQRMPEMNGTEFLARVKTLYPETVRMVLSGYSEISAVTDSINKGAVYRFMLKPWDDEQLKGEIVSALRHWRKLYGPKQQED
jgi:diguanylate cyclase (GGDEF)-like protein/PAS domain S-box-containing protein